MPWKTLSLHFKQTYEGGYRYLDNCGEFMLAAAEALNVIPGEIKPSGAKMEIPEKGINAACDTTALTVMQELPVADEKDFIEVCEKLATLTATHFRPKSIIKNGLLWKSYTPFPKSAEMLAATLNFGGDSQLELAKVVGMVPEYKKLDYFFVSGSKDMQVTIQPVTFERVNLPKRNPTFKSTPTERARIDRLNQFAERIAGDGGLSNALVLDVDLMERNPPEGASLEKHFEELKQKTDSLRKMFSTK